MEASPRNESALSAGTNRPGRENVIPTSVDYEAGRGAAQAGAKPFQEFAAERGIRIFPVHTIVNGACSCGTKDCGDAGKHPIGSMVPHGVKDASSDPVTIKRWWGAMPTANIGMATGGGLIVVDLDLNQGKAGDESWAALEKLHGKAPPTVEVLTGGGGTHLWFTVPAGIKIGNSAQKLGSGIDIRGDGGYVLVPESLHKSGNRYRFEGSSDPTEGVEPAPAPAWLLTLLTAQPAQAQANIASISIPPETYAELRSALSILNHDCRDTFGRVGNRLKELGAQGFALFDEWCQRSDKYDSRYTARHWNTFKPSSTGYPAIFVEAQSRGWLNPKSKLAVQEALGGDGDGPGAEPTGLLSEHEAEALLAWSWRTGATLPSADDAGIFLGPPDPKGKRPEYLRVKVQVNRGNTAPWIKIAWVSGPDSFIEEAEKYISRREEKVEKENLRRMERGEKPQDDISPDDLRSHAESWLARVRGVEVPEEKGRALYERVGGAGPWPEPEPLVKQVQESPYPLDALPGLMREAVQEVQGFTQAPLSMVATCALSAVSLAAQAHGDVERAPGLDGPCSLFSLVVASSGERKSSVDKYFTAPIRGYERSQEKDAKATVKQGVADLDAWTAERTGLLEKIRHLAKESKPTAELREILASHEMTKPEAPRVLRLLYNDVTPEELTRCLAHVWPSAGVLSSEAGSVFGGHGMGKDSLMRYLSVFNQCWDGTDQTFDRKTSGSYRVVGARLTVALQIQQATLRDFFAKSGMLARGTGFLARFLFAWPESTMGTRLWVDPPETWPRVGAYDLRLLNLLDQKPTLTETYALDPPKLRLSVAAKRAWIEYYNATEAMLAPAGDLHDIQDVAAKTADNAARIAALFHLFSGDCGQEIGEEHMAGAVRVAAWHLQEARRFLGELALPDDTVKAMTLDAWLVAHCRSEKKATIPKTYVMQHGPNSLRTAAKLDAALGVLVESCRVRLAKDGSRNMVQVNPALLGEVAQ